MTARIDNFDPDENSGIQLRYTYDVEDETEESESEKADEGQSLNPIPKNNRNENENVNSERPIEQFQLETDGEDVKEIGDIADTQCGFGSFRPHWLQKFASKKSFMLVFSLLAVIQGMSWAYFTATITTIEKRFKISSQTAGIVMTGNELSQVLFSIIIAYYGSHGHRPRWIAVGVLFSSLSCFLLASPHLFYGSGKDALSLTEEYNVNFNSSSSAFIALQLEESTSLPIRNVRSLVEDDDLYAKEKDLMEFDELEQIQTTSYPEEILHNPHDDVEMETKPEIGVPTFPSVTGTTNKPANAAAAHAEKESAKRNKIQLCEKSTGQIDKKMDCSDGDESIVPLVLIFLSQFVAGIGVLLFFSLGGPYLDDNIKKTQSPMLFGVTMSLRLIGPTLGFVLGSICLKIYISPSLTPIITNEDPRWMGAWWLGWVVLGGLMVITSFFIALFPKELPKAVERRIRSQMAKGTSTVANTFSNSRMLTVPENTSDMLRSGSQVFFTAEMAKENPIPKLSGQES